jgi:hypothetical protein
VNAGRFTYIESKQTFHKLSLDSNRANNDWTTSKTRKRLVARTITGIVAQFFEILRDAVGITLMNFALVILSWILVLKQRQ